MPPLYIVLVIATVMVVGIALLVLWQRAKSQGEQRDQEYRDLTGSKTVPSEERLQRMVVPRQRQMLNYRAIHIQRLEKQLGVQQLVVGKDPYEWEKIKREQSATETELDAELRHFDRAVLVINWFQKMLNWRLPTDWREHLTDPKQPLGQPIRVELPPKASAEPAPEERERDVSSS